jgi:hypothetical protein
MLLLLLSLERLDEPIDSGIVSLVLLQLAFSSWIRGCQVILEDAFLFFRQAADDVSHFSLRFVC